MGGLGSLKDPMDLKSLTVTKDGHSTQRQRQMREDRKKGEIEGKKKQSKWEGGKGGRRQGTKEATRARRMEGVKAGRKKDSAT